MNIIERAQAAVVAELFKQGDLMDAELGNIDVAQVDGSFQVAPLVRAVLKAIREPTPVMLTSTWIEKGVTGIRDDYTAHTVAREAWQAMIDAALADG